MNKFNRNPIYPNYCLVTTSTMTDTCHAICNVFLYTRPRSFNNRRRKSLGSKVLLVEQDQQKIYTKFKAPLHRAVNGHEVFFMTTMTTMTPLQDIAALQYTS